MIDCDCILSQRPKFWFLWKYAILAANLLNYRPRSEQAANEIYGEGHSFLRTYQTLSFISIRQSRLTCLTKPKYHVAQLIPMICGVFFWNYWNAGIPVQIILYWMSIPTVNWILAQLSEAMIHILRDVRRFRALMTVWCGGPQLASHTCVFGYMLDNQPSSSCYALKRCENWFMIFVSYWWFVFLGVVMLNKMKSVPDTAIEARRPELSHFNHERLLCV